LLNQQPSARIIFMAIKKEKNKLFESFINKTSKKQYSGVYVGLPPKNLKVGDLYFNNNLNVLYIFTGKEWKVVA
jgi:hypothetical protein